jgi:serine phosphatase RsbU (regulator of sigma subunit)
MRQKRTPCFIFLFVFLIQTCSSLSLQAANDDIQNQIEQYKLLVNQYEEEKNATELARYLTKLGYLYWQIDAGREAVSYFERSAEVNKQLKNNNALCTIYTNLGLISSELEEYQKAIGFFEKSLKLNQSSGNKEDIASDYLNIALAFQSLGYYAESNNRAKTALERALEINNLGIVKSSYGILAENAEKLGNSKESAEYYEKYNTITKHLQKQQMAVMESQTKDYKLQVQTTDKILKNTLDTLGEVKEMNREMQLQNELLNKENQLKEEQQARMEEQQARLEAREKTRRTQILYLIVVLGLLSFIIGLVYWQFSNKKKANHLLKEQNAEIERQKKEIETQHSLATQQKKRITDSIQYAKRIQKAVLPLDSAFSDNFKEYFILYKPKDIVSGDFYWITRKENVLILAVADCTGHGVPGAFMSMLGVAYLNEIVNKIAINKHISTLNADEILNELREMVINSLHQTGEPSEPKDGMDISICIIDFDSKKLQFAGANSPLYIVRNGELKHFEADKMPVSYHQKRNVPFTRQNFDLKPDDSLYLFSDGYIDQFGADSGNKFLSKRFRELILQIHDKPLADQLKIFNQTFEDWRGNKAQLDDVLVIGIRFASRSVAKPSANAYDWHDKTILIAEDTDVNYFLLTAVLKETKARLTRVKDGKEALDYIKNNEVDLILMDINMPNMNGYEATREIKAIRSHIPIVVQTAVHFSEEMEEAMKAGADDYISKPIDLKTFMRKMEKFLG